jgi:hypothetical protein
LVFEMQATKRGGWMLDCVANPIRQPLRSPSRVIAVTMWSGVSSRPTSCWKAFSFRRPNLSRDR